MRAQDIFDNKNITANSKQLAILKQNFPQCFDKSGKFDIETLSQILGVENIKKEGFELKFLGKSYARLTANLNPKTLLMPDIDHNSKNENAQNLLIKGDNLEVLKHLKNAYFESIKMIYIDPPYNTGSDGFVYKDDRKFSIDELSSLAGISQEEAKRVLEFTAKGSNSHSAWLSFIYPRLYIARELLRDDGVIFISIDDNEQAQLKILCDEIFGEENFVACLPTIMNLKGNNDEFCFAGTHEYTIVYSKNKNLLRLGEFNIDDEELDDWQIDEKGYFKQGANLKATGEAGRREDRPSLFFPIFIDADNKIYISDNDNPPFKNLEVIYPITNNQEMRWRWSKEKFKKDIDDVIVSRSGTIGLYKKQRPSLGDMPSKKPKTLFYKPSYSSGNGTAEVKNLFGEKIFSNPKPLQLLIDFIQISTNKDDLILDFFAGSGTTAHAVMAQNLEDGGNRKFILVQLDEKIDERNSKVAYDFCKNKLKSKNPTIFDITKERILRAAQSLSLSLSEDDARLKFKIFSAVPLLKSYLDNYLDGDSDTKEPNLFPKNELSKDDLTALLTTFAVYDGIKLTDELKRVDLGGYDAYYSQKKLYLINENFNGKNLKALVEKIDSDKEFAPEKIVIYEPSFESTRWRELDEAIKNYANKKNLQISLIVRH
ncbi:site-specific DNA-methyltransferase [Campylobacter concisus]